MKSRRTRADSPETSSGFSKFFGSLLTQGDLSRFGRDYLQVGMYTEVLFAQHDIHFIAIANNVDSQKGDNDLTPFVNLFNEWYARDCSRKQRAVARMKGMSGKRVASIAPYGYVKDKNGVLVPDEETAWVVKLILSLIHI